MIQLLGRFRCPLVAQSGPSTVCREATGRPPLRRAISAQSAKAGRGRQQVLKKSRLKPRPMFCVSSEPNMGSAGRSRVDPRTGSVWCISVWCISSPEPPFIFANVASARRSARPLRGIHDCAACHFSRPSEDRHVDDYPIVGWQRVSRSRRSPRTFIVGLMLTIFWTGEGLGADWPGADLALLVIFAVLVVVSLGIRFWAGMMRTQRAVQ